MKQFGILPTIILFLSFKSFCQLPNYEVDQFKLSKKKAIELKPCEQVLKISSNGYLIYLDKKTFETFLPIPSDSSKTPIDTIDLNPYYNIPNNKRPIENALYKTALTGKLFVKRLNGTALSGKIYTCRFEGKNQTGCVPSGECIYIKKTKTILVFYTTRLTNMVKLLD
ncbi:MAG: hypothetical protein JST26_07790 [Bacteroidetes bacterium]|nr:hypothetical protein [Bacteroidota bacterium]